MKFPQYKRCSVLKEPNRRYSGLSMKLQPILYRCPICHKNYFAFQQRDMCMECEKENDDKW
jgi:hypothetical protein